MVECGVVISWLVWKGDWVLAIDVDNVEVLESSVPLPNSNISLDRNTWSFALKMAMSKHPKYCFIRLFVIEGISEREKNAGKINKDLKRQAITV